ncbi:hypothetical protein AB4622_07740 [Vibrio splendidus]
MGANLYPVILVDWSDIGEQLRYMTLRASVALDGRAITIFELVFEHGQYNTPKNHDTFLDKLQSILPNKSARSSFLVWGFEILGSAKFWRKVGFG